MVAGIAVLAAPVAILAVGGYAIISNQNKKRLKQEKEMLVKEIVQRIHQFQNALKNRMDKTEERVRYLEALIIALRRARGDLEHDLVNA